MDHLSHVSSRWRAAPRPGVGRPAPNRATTHQQNRYVLLENHPQDCGHSSTLVSPTAGGRSISDGPASPQIIQRAKHEHPYEVPSVVAVPIIGGGRITSAGSWNRPNIQPEAGRHAALMVGASFSPPRPGWRDLAGRWRHARPQPQAPHQPTRHPSRAPSATLTDSRLRWLYRLPLAVSRHAAVTQPRGTVLTDGRAAPTLEEGSPWPSCSM